MSTSREPTHPGLFVKSEILNERGLSITTCAKSLGVSRKTLTEFTQGKRRCSVVMARRLAEVFGTSPASWINMQAKRDMWLATNMPAPTNVKKLPK